MSTEIAAMTGRRATIRFRPMAEPNIAQEVGIRARKGIDIKRETGTKPNIIQGFIEEAISLREVASFA
jgi:hypothetical protein